jgi:tetratricopeptide (TPR) repeat protein
MRAILGATGFWSQAPSRAYTVAGSFVRYLLAQYGPAPLKAAYPAADFAGAYGKPLPELVAEWEAFVDALPLADRERRMAEDQFKTPSIFAKPCAHEIAQLRARAAKASGDKAIAIYRDICTHLGDSTSSRFDLAQALRRAGDDVSFTSEATSLLELQDLTPGQRAILDEMQGPLAWQRGDVASARKAFETVLELDGASDSQRLQWVRIWALGRPQEQSERLRTYLDGDIVPVRDALTFERWMRTDTGDPTMAYLFGRLMARESVYDIAAAALEPVVAHPFLPIESERLRLIAESHARLGQHEAAIADYKRYMESAQTSGERARAEDALGRLEWQRLMKR